MSDEIRAEIREIRLYIRNVRTRMPFRYGKASLVAAPVLHVRMDIQSEDGSKAEGYSADCLPPKWFDKSPEKDFRRNVEDLVTAVRTGAECYLEVGSEPASLFEVWGEAYRKTVSRAGLKGLNGLTGSFGSSLMERALIDGICKLAGTGFYTCLLANRFGLEPGAVHPELSGRDWTKGFSPEPPEEIFIRHTVGLSDPIRTGDIPEEERLNDGLPQSLEDYIDGFGIRFFKIKVTGNLDADVERLSRISELLEEKSAGDYQVSLDGNESFTGVDPLTHWTEEILREPRLQEFLRRVLYFEQPLERGTAFHPQVTHYLSKSPLGPVIIDESDDALGTFKTAVETGYRGVSVKNCKGVLKGLFNRMLVDFYNEQGKGEFLLTGEDLMNVPVVPLHQDLVTMGTLGLSHVERNGHHYCRGLAHLSQLERVDCLNNHPDLYETYSGGARLRIQEGRIRVRSLFSDGFGACMTPDFESMSPLEDWNFDSLGTGA